MTIETMNLENLADKTVFLTLSFSTFGNLRKADVEINSDAIQSRFKHQKALLDSPELKAITKADTAVKGMIESLCLPSKFDTGIRFVPLVNVKKIRVILEEYQEITRPALVETFIAVLDEQIAEAKTELKSEFNELQYPSKESMRKKFGFSFQFISFGTPEKLKVHDPEAYEKEQKKAHSILMDAASEVVLAMRATALELTKKLADVLTPDPIDGKQKKLFDAHVDQLKKFVTDFSTLNVANDDELEKYMTGIKGMLEGVDADKLRHSDSLKAEMAKNIGDVAKALAPMVEVKGRKFRDAIVPEVPDVQTQLDQVNVQEMAANGQSLYKN